MCVLKPCASAKLVKILLDRRPMNELEKATAERYGGSTIPEDEVLDILKDAARKNLICREDVYPIGPQDVSGLVSHISKLRRKFLYSDKCEFINEDFAENMHSSSEGAADPNMVDKVLAAYFEYENRTRREDAGGKRVAAKIGLGAGLAVAAAAVAWYLVYTPAPY